jgi:hypothetical protein
MEKQKIIDVTVQKRLNEAREAGIPWKKWGPYLSERQWGTIRGASHQTGWTDVVAPLLDLFGRVDAKTLLETGRGRVMAVVVSGQVGGERREHVQS